MYFRKLLFSAVSEDEINQAIEEGMDLSSQHQGQFFFQTNSLSFVCKHSSTTIYDVRLL